MRSLGFDLVIDYTKEDFTRNGRRYDLILDTEDHAHGIRVRALAESTRNCTRPSEDRKIARLLRVAIVGWWIGMSTVRLIVLQTNLGTCGT